MTSPACAGERRPWVLVGLSVLGPFGIDLYLPAAAGVARDLRSSPLELQQVLSAYLIGICIMNLWLGALADRFGRRPASLWSTAFFVGASLGCAQATSMSALITWRLLQGMAGGVGIVIAQAVIRDLYPADRAQRIISLATGSFVLGPVVAPWIGGWLYVLAGWRSTFVALAALGSSVLLMTLRGLPESLPAAQRQSMAWRSLVQGYGGILGNPRFLLLVLAINAPVNGFFLYMVASPVFLGRHLAMQPSDFFWFFAALMAGVAFGSLVAARCAGRGRPMRQVMAGFAVMAVMAALNLALDALLGARLWAASGTLMGYAAGWALAFPVFLVQLADLDTQRRGLTCALHAVMGAAGNAVVAGLVAPWVMNSTQAMALTCLLLMTLGLASWLFLSLRWPEGAGRPARD